MTLTENLKRMKSVPLDCDAVIRTIKAHAAKMEDEESQYSQEDFNKMCQSVQDSMAWHEKNARDRMLTNLLTKVTINLDGKPVTKTIAEWKHRQTHVIPMLVKMYQGMQDGMYIRNGQQCPRAMRIDNNPVNGEKQPVKLQRYYNPIERDQTVRALREEALRINIELETVNATTNVISLDDIQVAPAE